MLKPVIAIVLCISVTFAATLHDAFTFKCSAAMVCVDKPNCDINGIIVKTTVTLTAEEEAFRQPLLPCKKIDGNYGVCCRDPDYRDDWPSSKIPHTPSITTPSTTTPYTPSTPSSTTPHTPSITTPSSKTPHTPSITTPSTTTPHTPSITTPSTTTPPNFYTRQLLLLPITTPSTTTPHTPSITTPSTTTPHTPSITTPSTTTPHTPSITTPSTTTPHTPSITTPSTTTPHTPSITTPSTTTPYTPSTPSSTTPHTPSITTPSTTTPHTPSITTPSTTTPHTPTSTTPSTPVTTSSKTTLPITTTPKTPPPPYSNIDKPDESRGCPSRNRTAMPDKVFKPYDSSDFEAGAGEFPWQGAVFTQSGQFLCSCYHTIYSTCTTTASCIKEYVASELKVAVGIYNIADPLSVFEFKKGDKNPQIYGVSVIAFDPKYNSKVTTKNDIAILQLNTKVNYNYYTKFICLDEHYAIPFFNYDDCVVTGWGESNTLHYIDVELLSESECKSAVPDFDPKAMSCAKPNHDVCKLAGFGGGMHCRETGKRNKKSVDIYLLKGVYSAVDCGKNIITFSKIDFKWFNDALLNPSNYTNHDSASSNKIRK
ncbi:uncharacterized protein LOC134832585 [Culicoides brevitarsis]|uniref:uncharacterized protein LOC134832585 n=1 Tax=Culicoides brevitarsis TaxID=469753 RepID=UPI00307B19E7